MIIGNDDAHWHLDKRVPVAIIFTLLMQTAAALLWAGSTSERLAQLEVSADGYLAVHERTVRLEEQGRHMKDSLNRIEAKLDQLVDKGTSGHRARSDK